jgi:hypothetical protein
VGETLAGRVPGRGQAAAGQHMALARAAHALGSSSRSSRYFGGLWFKLFNERGPC